MIIRVNNDGNSYKYLTHIKVKYTFITISIFYATSLKSVKQNDRSVMIRLIFASISKWLSLMVCWKMESILKFHFESFHQVTFIFVTLSIELNNYRIYFIHIWNNLDFVTFYDYAWDLMGSFGFLPHYRAVTSRGIWRSGYFSCMRSV